jgi:hypothetical protein
MTAIPDDIPEIFSKRSNLGEVLARRAAAAQGKVWGAMSDADHRKDATPRSAAGCRKG